MLKRKPSGARGSDKTTGGLSQQISRTRHVTAIDPDEAPELNDDFFDRAEIMKGGKIVQRGRPPIAGGKEAVKLRIDKDILSFYRGGGPGWQSRINATLRRAAQRSRRSP